MDHLDQYAELMRFHGHPCPSSAFGLRVGQVAVERLGRHSRTNKLMAIAESVTCAVDGIQVSSGCTLGNRNLVHQDNGKSAFTFWRRGDSGGIRISALPGSMAFRSQRAWDLWDLVAAGTATDEQEKEFAQLQDERREQLLAVPTQLILQVAEVPGEAPSPLPDVSPALPCERCHEPTTGDLLHNHRGEMLCPSCHLVAHDGVLPADHASHHHGHDHSPGHGHDH